MLNLQLETMTDVSLSLFRLCYNYRVRKRVVQRQTLVMLLEVITLIRYHVGRLYPVAYLRFFTGVAGYQNVNGQADTGN